MFDSFLKRATPSLVSLFVILVFLAHFRMSQATGRREWPLDLLLQSGTHPAVIGSDFSIYHRACNQLLSREEIYFDSHGTYPNYDHIPQSLLVMLPFSLKAVGDGYLFFIRFSFFSLFLLFLLSAKRLGGQSLFWYGLFFAVAVLLSDPGALLYGRGNMDGLAAVFVYAAFLLLLNRKHAGVAVFLALATCLKPLYGPFFVFLFLLKDRWKLVGWYVLVHLLACAAVSWIYGTPGLFTGYFRSLPTYIGFMKRWHGGQNIGFLSQVAHIAPRHGDLVMSMPASLLVFAALAGLGILLWGRRLLKSGGLEDGEKILPFVFFGYATVLWQCVSFAYGSFILLLAVPVADKLYESSSSNLVKGLLVAHAVCLGIIFSLDPNLNFPTIPRGPYYLAALALWISIAARGRSADLRTSGATSWA
jgi:hypothetical protein